MGTRGIEAVSDEVLLRIASCLDSVTITRLAMCSRRFYRLASDAQLWKSLYFVDFVQPSLGSDSRTQSLPTLAGLRSLLLHQNLVSDKRIRGDGKGIVRLPHRYYRDHESTDTADQLANLFRAVDSEAEPITLDWKQVYRVSTNWKAGNFVASDLPAPPRPVDSEVNGTNIQTIVRASANFVFLSRTSDRGAIPVVDIFAETSRGKASLLSLRPDDLTHRSPIGQLCSIKLEAIARKTSKTYHITDIAVDAASEAPVMSTNKRKACDTHDNARPSLCVMVSYSDGHFALFQIAASPCSIADDSFKVNEVYFHESTPRSRDVVASALHSSALVLCSKNFDISIFQILEPCPESPATRVELVQQLSSYRSSWPASIRLKRIPYHRVQKATRHSSATSAISANTSVSESSDEAAFRLTIAYATPAYPSSWTIGVQEIVLRLCMDPARGAKGSRVTSRHANARHVHTSTPIDLRGSSMLSQPVFATPASQRPFLPWSRSRFPTAVEANRMTSLSYDDPFVVLGASNNVLEVYELYGATTHVRLDRETVDEPVKRSATATPASSKDTLRLVHRRILYGHTGSVHSVALEDGRCVSGGADGNVMVWNLGERVNEGDSVAGVLQRHKESSRPRQQKKGSVRDESDASSSLEFDDADEAVDMTHVLTLQTPFRNIVDNNTPDNVATEEHKTADAVWNAKDAMEHSSGLRDTLLHSNLASSTQQETSRGVIRWVSTTFDKIISIATYPSSNTEISNATMPSRERIQIWNF